MEDHLILEGFRNRDQSAVEQAKQKYGDACMEIAERILGEHGLAQTVVESAFFRAWDAIPSKEPQNLEGYLLRLTRNLAVDQAAQHGEYDRALRELERCIPRTGEALSQPLTKKELRRTMDAFLGSLSPENRRLLVLRYWYLCSYEEIARLLGRSEDQVSKTLRFLRSKLREFLQQKDIQDLSAVQFLRVFGSIRDGWILDAGEPKGYLPSWLKIAVIGITVCCVFALGAFFVFQERLPEETKAPQPSDRLPPVTTTEQEPSTVESTSAITEPIETDPPHTEPPDTEPSETAYSIEDSAAYQKLLSLPNAELYLSNAFGYNYLEIFAEWIVSQEGLMEIYPEQWHLQGYADGAAGLTCYSPLEEDNSRRYYYIQILDYDDIFPYPETGIRYFTDIPREEVVPLVYNASDPIGVDAAIKEAFIDYILYSDWFAWSVLDPEFRTEWSYEIVTIHPEAEISCKRLQLNVDVWRSGMTEEEPFRCWLIYDPDWKQVSYGHDGALLRGGSDQEEMGEARPEG